MVSRSLKDMYLCTSLVRDPCLPPDLNKRVGSHCHAICESIRRHTTKKKEPSKASSQHRNSPIASAHIQDGTRTACIIDTGRVRRQQCRRSCPKPRQIREFNSLSPPWLRASPSPAASSHTSISAEKSASTSLRSLFPDRVSRNPLSKRYCLRSCSASRFPVRKPALR